MNFGGGDFPGEAEGIGAGGGVVGGEGERAVLHSGGGGGVEGDGQGDALAGVDRDRISGVGLVTELPVNDEPYPPGRSSEEMIRAASPVFLMVNVLEMDV